jgi:4-oxalocrotonate tautomerase family enzyme
MMPVITVEGPRIPDLDRKRQLVQEFTEAASKAFGLGNETIIVILHETSPECVATGGKLICDRYATRQAAGGQASDA